MEIKTAMFSNPTNLLENQTLKDAVKLYLTTGVNCAPVFSLDAQVIGILTVFRVLQALLEGASFEELVGNLAEKNTMAVCERDSLEELLQKNMPCERLLVYDEHEKFSGILSNLQIIRKVFNSFEKTKDELKVIIESAHNAIIAINSDEIITVFNRSAEEITGVAKENALGQSLSKVIPNSGLPSVLKSGKKEYAKHIVLNGHEVITNRTPLYHNSEIIGAVAILQDLSELIIAQEQLDKVKRLNSELESVIETSYDGLILVTAKGEICKANSASEAIFNRKLTGQSLGDISEELEKIYKEVMFNQFNVSKIVHLQNGKSVLVTGNPCVESNGVVKELVFNLRDVTEWRQLKNELKQSQEQKEIYSKELYELRLKLEEDDGIIAQSNEMKKIIQMAKKVAESDINVLITGESGVGKEVVARIVHRFSNRKDLPFIEVNCGAIPENLLESELFGYEGGAFTGARKEGKPGLFEIADKGTIFLDEIGEIPLEMQVKLLRVIQERKVIRVGGTSHKEINIRIIAATNRDLSQMVAEGKFREDLFYRLNVLQIKIPPIRDRREDILPLALSSLNKFNKKYNVEKVFSPEVYKVFEKHSWPGNVREIENVVERAVVMSSQESVEIEDLPDSFTAAFQPVKAASGLSLQINQILPLKEAQEILEKQLVAKALEEGKSLRRAAEILGVTHTTVRRKIVQYNLDAETV